MSFDANASPSTSAPAKIPREVKRLTAPRCVVCREAEEVEGVRLVDDGAASPCRRRRRLRLLPLPPCKCSTVLVDPSDGATGAAALRGLVRASDAMGDADRARMVRRALSKVRTRVWKRTPMCLHCVRRMLEAAEEVIEYDYHYADEGGGGGGARGGGGSRAQNQQRQRNPRFTVEPKCPKCKTKFSPRNLHRVVESAEALSLRSEGEDCSGRAAMHGGRGCSSGAVRELEAWFEAIGSTALVVSMVRLERRSRPPPSVPPVAAAGPAAHSDSETVTEDDSDSEDEHIPGAAHARRLKRQQMAKPGEIVQELMSKDPKFKQDREDAEYLRSKLKTAVGRAEVIGEGGVLLTEEEIAERRRREDEDSRLARELQEADDGGGGGAVTEVDDDERRRAEEDRRRREEEDARLARELQEADDGGGGGGAKDAQEKRRREEEDARLAAREHERMVQEERARLRKESQHDALIAKEWQCKLDAAAGRDPRAIKPQGKDLNGGALVDGENADESKAVVTKVGSRVCDNQDDSHPGKLKSRETNGRIDHQKNVSSKADANLPCESRPPIPADKHIDSSSFGGRAEEEGGTTRRSPPNVPNGSHSSSASMITSPNAEAKGVSSPHAQVAAGSSPSTSPASSNSHPPPPTAKKAGGVRGGGALFRTLPTRKNEREKNKRRRLGEDSPAAPSAAASSPNAVASPENEHPASQSPPLSHSPVLSHHAPPSCAPVELSNGNMALEPSESGQPRRRNSASCPSPRRKKAPAPTTPRSRRASSRRSSADGAAPTDSSASASDGGSSPWARATLGKRAAERERDLSRMTEMGFARSDVMNCYRDSGEDFDTAIAMLLSAQADP